MKHKPKAIKQSRKFILTVGEDGGILVYMEGKRVLRRMFAPSPAHDELKHFESLIDNDPAASIAILVDTMDQTYIQQTLPPVSPLGINKLIERRLERDFSASDIKGATKLDRSSEGRREWHYLFISVANQPPLSRWIEFVIDRPNPCQGIFLLPVESEWLIQKLKQQQVSAKKSFLPKLTVKKSDASVVADRPKWVILVSHNKVGGFRQIVTRNGRVIFTRLSQPIGEPSPPVIAGNIEQEINNTVEYLKRLSYVQADPLEIIVIVAHEIRQHLTLEGSELRHVSVRTPHEVAEEIGAVKATEEGDHFGDVVFASAFGLAKIPRKRFSIPELDKILQLQGVRSAVDIFTKLAVPALVGLALWSVWGIFTAGSDISFTEGKRNDAKARIAKLEQDKKALPPDMDKIIDSAQLDGVIAKNTFSPLPMIADFSKLLDENTLVKAIDWVSAGPYPGGRRMLNPKDIGAPGQPPQIEAGFTVEFLNNNGDIDEFLVRSDKFLRSATSGFNGYKVTFSDIPGITRQSQAVEVNFGQDKAPVNQLPSKDISVKYTISGPVKAEKTQAGGAQ